jgi:hypothetical protein
MGGEVLGVATADPDAVVAVAADVRPSVLEHHRRRHPGVRFTTDPDEVLGTVGPDAVYIATPPAHHAGLVLAGLRRGLAVFREKPLAVDLGDGGRMREAAASAATPCVVNFAPSDRHAVLEVERALHAGEVGGSSGSMCGGGSPRGRGRSRPTPHGWPPARRAASCVRCSRTRVPDRPARRADPGGRRERRPPGRRARQGGGAARGLLRAGTCRCTRSRRRERDRAPRAGPDPSGRSRRCGPVAESIAFGPAPKARPAVTRRSPDWRTRRHVLTLCRSCHRRT